MSHVLALPFTLSRSDSILGGEVISTTERVHGLLLIDGERLVIQWRVSRATQRVGAEIRTDALRAAEAAPRMLSRSD